MVTHLADGTALDAVWRELRKVLNIWNAKRTAIASLLAFETTDAATAVLQGFDHGLLQRASEFGEPQAQGRLGTPPPRRPPPTRLVPPIAG